jgi:hypothetical protein
MVRRDFIKSAGLLGEAAMNTADGYEQAAKKAAERWKDNPTCQLKEQIIATWRMTKEHRADTESNVRIRQLQLIWQAAFKDAVSWDFDFTKDDRNEF